MDIMFNNEQREEIYKIFAECFHDVIVPLLEEKASKDDIARLETKVAGIETKVDGLQTRVAGIETKVDGLQTRVAGIETKVDGLQTRVAGVETKVDGLQTRVAGIETKVDGLQTKVDGINSKLDKVLDNQNKQLQILGKYNERIASLENRLNN